MTIVTVVAGTTCVFAVAAGGGLSALVQGLVFTGLGIASVARIDVAMRVLRPTGRMVILAGLFAAGGLLIVTLLHRFLADLPRLLDAVHAGGPSLTPQLAQAARGQPVALPPGADPRTLLAALTPAELDVVKRLAAGRLPKQVAHDLNIDKGAVDSRIKSARRKTGARTTVRLLWLYATCDGS